MKAMKATQLLLGITIAALAACGKPEPAVAPPPPPPPVAKPAPPPALIKRSELFGSPERTAPQLSPDGKRIAFLAPVDKVLNVWVGPVEDINAAKPVTHSKLQPIYVFAFAYDNKHLLYQQDDGGNENWHLYSVNLDSGKEIDLTPLKDISAQYLGASDRHPTTILAGLNDRGDHSWHDLYRIDVASGKRTLLEKNPGGIETYVSDQDLKVRLAKKPTPEGGYEFLRKDAKGKWETFAAVPLEDALTSNPLGFDASGTSLYWIDSRNRNTAGLFAQDWQSGESKLLFEDARSDVQDVMRHPATGVVEAVASNFDRLQWQPLGDAVKADLAYLQTLENGEVSVVSRSLDDSRWLVQVLGSDKPLHFYLYERGAKQAKLLFSHRPWLEGKPLAPMYARVIKSRDGLDLVSYLTLPVESDPDRNGVPVAPQPLVLNVHGGPWGRDTWGFNNEHLWLANRGYAVLSVNFRASTGLGKSFLNAGNLQWGRTMHDDLIDALDWAVKQKIADPAKAAVYGGSYGGYAALASLTFTPERFACAVDIVGPSNLNTLLASIPPYWKSFFEQFARRVGDPRTEDGKALLTERSPLTHVGKIVRPLLIAQGANDPRVKQAEADQIVAAMKAKNIPVTYVLYPDEGHGFRRPPNRTSFYAISESFLSKCLGGRMEPVGSDFEGSSVQVLEGVEHVPGIKEALGSPPPAPAAAEPVTPAAAGT